MWRAAQGSRSVGQAEGTALGRGVPAGRCGIVRETLTFTAQELKPLDRLMQQLVTNLPPDLRSAGREESE